MKNSKIFLTIAMLLIVLLAGAAWLLVTHKAKARDNLRTDVFEERDTTASATGQTSGPNTNGSAYVERPAIIPKNAPVVTGFAGQLALQCNPQPDGTKEPFVVGEYLKLEAECQNAVEYRWTVNGEVIKEKGQEWSTRADRFFDVTQPGPLAFTVQVRGTDKTLVSQVKETSLNILPLKIMRISKSILHDDDEHFITGEAINLEVAMAATMIPDLDFYQYRYFVNDVPIKHPDDGEEWTTFDYLNYTFETPGNFTFKVEARRRTSKAAEDAQELPETVVAADAVLLSFDSTPSHEVGAPVGAPVNLGGFPTSRYGKSESRIGVKKINAADFNWIRDDSGTVWGDPYRTWLPIEPGTYVVRCEIRELGKEVADDFRELIFTVTDGNF